MISNTFKLIGACFAAFVIYDLMIQYAGSVMVVIGALAIMFIAGFICEMFFPADTGDCFAFLDEKGESDEN